MSKSCIVCQEEGDAPELKKCSSSGCQIYGHEKCVKYFVGKNSLRKWKCLLCNAKGPNSPTTSQGNPFATDYARALQMQMQDDGIKDKVKETIDEALKTFGQTFALTLAKQIADLNKKIDTQNEKIEAQDKSIASLSNKVEEQKGEINDLWYQINILEQAQLSKNIEIQGIPEIPGENVSNIVKGIATAIEADETMEGAICYRGRKMKNKPAVIVVKFSKEAHKETWLAGRKKDAFKNYILPNRFAAATGAANGAQLKMRVFEQITYFTRQLLYDTQEAAYANKFKFVWTKGGKVFVRKDENTKALIRINCKHDITTKIVLNKKNPAPTNIQQNTNSDDKGSNSEGEGSDHNETHLN